MEVISLDARRALRRANRSASRALDVAHRASLRKLRQARRDATFLGGQATRFARSANAWMGERPYLATLAALTVGIVLGASLRSRR